MQTVAERPWVDTPSRARLSSPDARPHGLGQGHRTMPGSESRRNTARARLLLAPSLALLLFLVVVPIGFVAVYSFWLRTATGAVRSELTLANWRELFGDAYYWRILGRTVRLSV